MTDPTSRDAAPPTSEPHFTPEHDAHYRALHEGAAAETAVRSYDDARPAYQLGHLAAQHPEHTGRTFDAAEPELRRTWNDDFRGRHGEWESVRRHVCDAYGHARSEGYGSRRDRSTIGTGGSAVDPVELERARAGLPSRDDEQGSTPRVPTALAATSRAADRAADRAASVDAETEITPDEAHRDRLAR